MYFLKKNNAASSLTEESFDCLPRLSERVKMAKFKNESSCDLEEYYRYQK